MANKPQWQIVLEMLEKSPCTTADFINTYGLAAEYRRAVSELRAKNYAIKVTRLRAGCWQYKLIGKIVDIPF